MCDESVKEVWGRCPSCWGGGLIDIIGAKLIVTYLILKLKHWFFIFLQSQDGNQKLRVCLKFHNI